MSPNKLTLDLACESLAYAQGLQAELGVFSFNASIIGTVTDGYYVRVTSTGHLLGWGSMFEELENAAEIANIARCKHCGERFTAERPNEGGSNADYHADCEAADCAAKVQP